MIEDYIDGLLSDEERQKLKAHLETCEECRRSLRFSLALREMTRVSVSDMPEGLHERIIDSVSEESRSKKLGSRRKIFRLGAVSAACMLLCLCCTVVFLMLPGNHKSESGVPDDDPICAPEADINTEAEQTNLSQSAASSAGSVLEEESPKDEAETDAVEPEEPEAVAPGATGSTFQGTNPAEDITNASPDATEKLPETERIEFPSDDGAPDKEADDAPDTNHASDGSQLLTPPASAESSGSSRPGGEEITLALLIVSGLLAVASFIAFLISLSSVRSRPTKKE